MPDLHDGGAPASSSVPGAGSGSAGSMSRRSVLRGAAGAGAAGIAATALAGAAFPLAAGASTATPATHSKRTDGAVSADPAEAVVVHVRDASTGEIDVFRGTTCTRLHDRALAAQLVRASK